jgi:hypothetical protein
MNRRGGIHRLSMAAAVMVAVLLSAGCQPAEPAAVAQLPSSATATLPADTPALPSPAATETNPVVATATVPVQESEAPVAPIETPSPPATGAEAASAVAMADLSQRLGIPTQDIVILSVEAVDWPDSSLGCPQPGMMYAQFITPGFRVVLEAGGVRHEYHTDQRASAVWCRVLNSGGRPLEGGNGNVQDGWPSQPIANDVTVEPPAKGTREP